MDENIEGFVTSNGGSSLSSRRKESLALAMAAHGTLAITLLPWLHHSLSYSQIL
jgi:hypothetical protein